MSGNSQQQKNFSGYGEPWTLDQGDRHRSMVKDMSPIQIMRMCITLGVKPSDKIPLDFLFRIRSTMLQLELLCVSHYEHIVRNNLEAQSDTSGRPAMVEDLLIMQGLFLRLDNHLERDNLARLLEGECFF
jgi:hypothetical protein